MPKLATKALVLLGLALAAASCTEADPESTWLSLPDTYPHEVIESTGIEGGQLVIALDTSVTREEALEVGQLILDQAPPDITVNARLYDDVATARNWQTANAQLTLEHLLVVARRTDSGGDEVRWVGPSPADSAAAQAAADSAAADSDPSAATPATGTPPS